MPRRAAARRGRGAEAHRGARAHAGRAGFGAVPDLRDTARSLEDLELRAARLTRYQVDWATPDALRKDLGRYEAATRDSVRALARQLVASGRVVIEVVPEGGGK